MRSVSWTESTEAAKKKHKKGEKKEKSGPPQQMKSCNLHFFSLFMKIKIATIRTKQ